MSVIVTGGGSGIGAATAARFAAGGAPVTICGRRPHAVERVADGAGPNCRAVTADVTVDARPPPTRRDRRRVRRRARHPDQQRRQHVPGVGHRPRRGGAPLRLPHQRGGRHAPHRPVRAPHGGPGRGAVCFLGSIHTQRAFPGASPYAATKGALEALTGVLAAELGPRNIRVNCVRPGAVLTEINQRAGLMDDDTARKRLEGLARPRAGPHRHRRGDRRSPRVPRLRRVDHRRRRVGRRWPRPRCHERLNSTGERPQ